MWPDPSRYIEIDCTTWSIPASLGDALRASAATFSGSRGAPAIARWELVS